MVSKYEEVRAVLRRVGVPNVFAEKIIAYVRSLEKHISLEGLLLFGSVARGNIRWGSDIDLIVVSRDLSKVDRFRLRREVAMTRPGAIEALWFTPDELIRAFSCFWGTLLDALADGIILIDELGLLIRLKKALEQLLDRGVIVRRRGRWILCSREDFIKSAKELKLVLTSLTHERIRSISEE